MVDPETGVTWFKDRSSGIMINKISFWIYRVHRQNLNKFQVEYPATFVGGPSSKLTFGNSVNAWSVSTGDNSVFSYAKSTVYEVVT